MCAYVGYIILPFLLDCNIIAGETYTKAALYKLHVFYLWIATA